MSFSRRISGVIEGTVNPLNNFQASLEKTFPCGYVTKVIKFLSEWRNWSTMCNSPPGNCWIMSLGEGKRSRSFKFFPDNQPQRETLISVINATRICGVTVTPSLPDTAGGGWKDLWFDLNSSIDKYEILHKPPILTSKSESIRQKILFYLPLPTLTFLHLEVQWEACKVKILVYSHSHYLLINLCQGGGAKLSQLDPELAWISTRECYKEQRHF